MTSILEHRRTEMEEYTVAEERLVLLQPIEVPTATDFKRYDRIHKRLTTRIAKSILSNRRVRRTIGFPLQNTHMKLLANRYVHGRYTERRWSVTAGRMCREIVNFLKHRGKRHTYIIQVSVHGKFLFQEQENVATYICGSTSVFEQVCAPVKRSPAGSTHITNFYFLTYVPRYTRTLW